jgi:hypothetical protein
LVIPALTPTTIPVLVTVSVFVLLLVHSTPAELVMSSFEPSGRVACACAEMVSPFPTPHGDGVIEISETAADEVLFDVPHAAQRARSGTAAVAITSERTADGELNDQLLNIFMRDAPSI